MKRTTGTSVHCTGREILSLQISTRFPFLLFSFWHSPAGLELAGLISLFFPRIFMFSPPSPTLSLPFSFFIFPVDFTSQHLQTFLANIGGRLKREKEGGRRRGAGMPTRNESHHEIITSTKNKRLKWFTQKCDLVTHGSKEK